LGASGLVIAALGAGAVSDGLDVGVEVAADDGVELGAGVDVEAPSVCAVVWDAPHAAMRIAREKRARLMA